MSWHPLVMLLMPHVRDIKHDADSGNGPALEVIRLYELYRACPSDPAANGLCEAAFQTWLDKRRKPQ